MHQTQLQTGNLNLNCIDDTKFTTLPILATISIIYIYICIDICIYYIYNTDLCQYCQCCEFSAINAYTNFIEIVLRHGCSPKDLCTFSFRNIDNKKAPVLESLFNKVAGLKGSPPPPPLKACSTIKKRLIKKRCLRVINAKVLRSAFFIEHHWYLLLNFQC